MRSLLPTLLLFLAALPLPAQLDFPGGPGERAEKTSIALIPEHSSIAPGSTTGIAIRIEHAPGWHSYHPDHQGPETLLTVDWKLPEGYKLKSLRYPEPKAYQRYGHAYRTFEGTFHLLAEIEIPENAPTKTPASLTATVYWQICNDQGQCEQDTSKDFSLSLPLAAEAAADPAQADLFQELRAELPPPPETAGEPSATKAQDSHAKPSLAATPEDIAAGAKLYDVNKKVPFVTLDGKEEKPLTLLRALPLAFLGGLILNLMPCVFPVLGIKIMGFVQQAGEDERKVKLHGLVFGLGILVSMWVLSGIIVALIQVWGKEINWGVQLTQPLFLAGIITLLFLLGLNMAGVFEMGTSLTGAGAGLQQKKGYAGSFFSGILTTLIATPCSGPYLGLLMGYTLAQAVPVALLIFTVFALGIAFPYVLLSFFPKLISKLPRPGAWMETFKVSMSFALFATAAFFLTSFLGQTGAKAGGWFIGGLVVLAMAAWAYGRWFTPATPKAKKYLWGLAFPAVLAVFFAFMTWDASSQRVQKIPLSHSDLAWHEWFPGKIELAQQREPERIIWIDYTAVW